MKKSRLLSVLCVFCFALVTSISHAAALYGAAYSGPDGLSTLHKIDPFTGVTTLVGPIGFERCGAMDFDASGTLYATCERADGSNTHVLITINPSTGAGTEVGPTGVEFFNGIFDGNTFPDISFQPSDGTLIALSFPGEGLATVNPGTGAATQVGFATFNGELGFRANDGNGLAFDSSGTLFHAAGEGPTGKSCSGVPPLGGGAAPGCPDLLHTVDPVTSLATISTELLIPAAPPGVTDLRDPRPNAMDFDPATGSLFASIVYGFGGTASYHLAQIDTTTGDVIIIGPMVSGLDALAFFPTPVCNIEMSQATYIDGETMTASVFRIANLTSAAQALELKVWLSAPGIPPISVVNVGADGSFVLPAGTDFDLGPIPLVPVTVGLPRGNYEFSCRMLDPTTGELLVEDRNLFSLQ